MADGPPGSGESCNDWRRESDLDIRLYIKRFYAVFGEIIDHRTRKKRRSQNIQQEMEWTGSMSKIKVIIFDFGEPGSGRTLKRFAFSTRPEDCLYDTKIAGR